MWENKILRTLWLVVYSIFCKTKCSYIGLNGKTVKILANGPSLKKDLNNLIETDSTCVLNFFCLDNLFWQIKPQHYVLADHAFFIAEKASNVVRLYEAINSIDWEITFYVPLRYYSIFKDRVGLNAYIRIKTFYRFPILHKYIPQSLEYYLFRRGISAPASMNVLIPSVYVMLNEGYEMIYLYGADHSWMTQLAVNSQNQLCIRDSHFYDTSEAKLKPWLLSNGTVYKLVDVLNDWAETFSMYHVLQSYRNHMKMGTIINMTQGSFIDAFEKTSNREDVL